jgi:hypothetical protein
LRGGKLTREAQLRGLARAQGPDHFANVGEELAGEALALLDLLAWPALRQVAGRFEVETQMRP